MKMRKRIGEGWRWGREGERKGWRWGREGGERRERKKVEDETKKEGHRGRK